MHHHPVGGAPANIAAATDPMDEQLRRTVIAWSLVAMPAEQCVLRDPTTVSVWTSRGLDLAWITEIQAAVTKLQSARPALTIENLRVRTRAGCRGVMMAVAMRAGPPRLGRRWGRTTSRRSGQASGVALKCIRELGAPYRNLVSAPPGSTMVMPTPKGAAEKVQRSWRTRAKHLRWSPGRGEPLG